MMDKLEFEGSFFQRVFQYIRRYSREMSLDDFNYVEDTVEGEEETCLETLLG